jgi:hypothetical protein
MSAIYFGAGAILIFAACILSAKKIQVDIFRQSAFF